MTEGFGDFDRFGPGVDPEAGIPAGGDISLGIPEGPNMGTGEGHFGPQMRKMDYYQQLGQQLRTALGGPQQQAPQAGGGLTSGFNMDWLSQALAAGSANGAHL